MRPVSVLPVFCFVFCSILPPAGAQTQPASVQDLLDAKLANRLRAVEDGISGVLGYAVIDLETGHTLSRNAGIVFPQASSIKIPIMMQVFEQVRDGRLNLAETVTLTGKEAVGGSGHLRLLLRSRPVTLSFRDLVTAMIETSDNTATNRLIAAVGMNRVNAMLDRMGFRQTRLRRIMLDTAAAQAGNENVSTPMEMAKLMELIYRGKAVNGEASREMVEILKLPAADFRAAVPPAVAVASKPGGLNGVRCETGIVFVPGRPFVLSVASTFLDGGENPVQDVTRIVYQHFAKLARSNRYGHAALP